jgi:hypothetical protein
MIGWKAIKTVNEVPLNEIMSKGFMVVRKRNMSWRLDNLQHYIL